MELSRNKNVGITNMEILAREKECFDKFIEKYKGKCDAEHAQECYLLATGTAGQLVLAAVELGNLDYANQLREFLNIVNIEYFIDKKEKNNYVK